MSTAVVYRAFDDNDRLLYVGCTVDFDGRLRYHAEHSPWYPFRARIETTEYPSRTEAAEAESLAITTEHPRWNIKGRSPQHPDGPLNSRFTSPHLALEVEAWREWKKVQSLRAELTKREARLKCLMSAAAVEALGLADTA